MMVMSGPLTLLTVTAFVSTALLRIAPYITRLPVAYRPLVTSTSLPAASPADTASWIVVAAVDQLAYGCAGAAFDTLT